MAIRTTADWKNVINNDDSIEVKYQKMVKTAKEILNNYNNGGNKND